MTNSVLSETKVSSRIKKNPVWILMKKHFNHPFIFKEMYAPEEGAVNKIPIHGYSESRFSCVFFILIKGKNSAWDIAIEPPCWPCPKARKYNYNTCSIFVNTKNRTLQLNRQVLILARRNYLKLSVQENCEIMCQSAVLFQTVPFSPCRIS